MCDEWTHINNRIITIVIYIWKFLIYAFKKLSYKSLLLEELDLERFFDRPFRLCDKWPSPSLDANGPTFSGIIALICEQNLVKEMLKNTWKLELQIHWKKNVHCNLLLYNYYLLKYIPVSFSVFFKIVTPKKTGLAAKNKFLEEHKNLETGTGPPATKSFGWYKWHLHWLNLMIICGLSHMKKIYWNSHTYI